MWKAKASSYIIYHWVWAIHVMNSSEGDRPYIYFQPFIFQNSQYLSAIHHIKSYKSKLNFAAITFITNYPPKLLSYISYKIYIWWVQNLDFTKSLAAHLGFWNTTKTKMTLVSADNNLLKNLKHILKNFDMSICLHWYPIIFLQH